MNDSISKKIQQLNYDPNVILASNGEKVENLTSKEDFFEGDQYIVLTHEKKKAAQKNFDITIVNAMNDRTYPGSLLLANENLVNNMPDALYAKRAPITIRLNLPGMEQKGTKRIENPSYSSVSEAINEILNEWIKTCSDKYKIATNYSYSESEIFSKEHMKLVVGFSLPEKMNTSFDFNSVVNHEKRMFVVTFKQIFYTASIDVPTQPGDFFAEDETWQNLVDNGVSDKTPPVYVSNVAYGRIVYLIIMSESTDSEIGSKIKALIKGNTLSSETEFKAVFKNAELSVFVLGGNPEDHIQLTTNDPSKIREIISSNASFSEKNQGAPISYTGTFLKGNQIAVINGSTEYIETTRTQYSKGKLSLKHTGGYVAKFEVTWKERKYDKNGNPVYTNKSWEMNGKSLTAPFSTEIPLPANTVDLHVKAIEKTGLLWEPWRTIIDQDVKLHPNAEASIWGTTLNQKGEVKYNS